MKLEAFEKAKFLRDTIDHMNVKLLQLEKMKKRTGDEEFKLARELAYDSIRYAIGRLEKDFEIL